MTLMAKLVRMLDLLDSKLSAISKSCPVSADSCARNRFAESIPRFAGKIVLYSRPTPTGCLPVAYRTRCCLRCRPKTRPFLFIGAFLLRACLCRQLFGKGKVFGFVFHEGQQGVRDAGHQAKIVEHDGANDAKV